MNIDLTGITVLVTGASRGIGHAIARQLAASGATVGIHYHRHRAAAEALAAALDTPTEVFQADLADVDACERLFANVVQSFGRLDVLVNNAGVALELPLNGSTAAWKEQWDRQMAINLRAPELLCRRAIDHFAQHGGGRIINVASRAAFRGDDPDLIGYAASKGGLVALTRSIARGFGKQNVKAFVLAPGWTRTDMAQDYIDTHGEGAVLGDLALNELTEPEHIAPLAVILASGLADHATGSTIDINAGSYVH